MAVIEGGTILTGGSVLGGEPTVYHGEGNPETGGEYPNASNGDIYHDHANGDVYEKQAGVWVRVDTL